VARQALATQPKKSPWTKARVATVSGLGQDAITAAQFTRQGLRNDLVTLIARERNVIISVSLQAQQRGGQISVSALRAGVLAIGRQVMAKAQAEPIVKR